ncbi:hypothetical protein GCM10027596_36180 [Nocardioides korecus]
MCQLSPATSPIAATRVAKTAPPVTLAARNRFGAIPDMPARPGTIDVQSSGEPPQEHRSDTSVTQRVLGTREVMRGHDATQGRVQDPAPDRRPTQYPGRVARDRPGDAMPAAITAS